MTKKDEQYLKHLVNQISIQEMRIKQYQQENAYNQATIRALHFALQNMSIIVRKYQEHYDIPEVEYKFKDSLALAE